MTEQFEVHYWPHTGRVMTVHTDDDGGAQVTDLRIVGTGGRGSEHLADTTAGLAEHLADRSNPQGSLAEHTPDGHVTYLWAAAGNAAGRQDLTFRLLATGITLPGPALTATNVGPLADGGRRGTLLRDGVPLGAILQPAGQRPTFEPCDPAAGPQLSADLAEFARSCRGADRLPVTLSVLLAALLTEYARPVPARPRRPRTQETR